MKLAPPFTLFEAVLDEQSVRLEELLGVGGARRVKFETNWLEKALYFSRS